MSGAISYGRPLYSLDEGVGVDMGLALEKSKSTTTLVFSTVEGDAGLGF